MNRLIKEAGGDGFSLAIPWRPRLQIFKAWSVLFRDPGGELIEAKIHVMTARRWERSYRDEADARWAVLRSGPLVVALRLTF